MSDIEIEIDGKKLSAQPNAMVIQVADEAGIYIPRFCYHKHLSIAANCRMCLVEVEKSPKPLPACATPVMAGMKVFTKSPKALAAQKAVMEFLLINHPLDCPICDQGGECELQDLSLGYGSAESYFHEGKRAVKDKDIGPLIATEMTRCIHCMRCVRFGTEVAGIRELGATGRGEHMEIGTYIEHAMQSEVSGNVIDLCPVGALTSKPFRFTARAWELTQRPTMSPHDCVGTHLNAHLRNGKVMRIVPRENAQINETWIADRDRYSYEALYHADRVAQPLIKQQGEWQAVSWQVALEFAVAGLQKVLATAGAEQLGALASPNATLEELYLLQKIMRGLGSANVDHRLRQVDLSDQQPVASGISLVELEQCDTIFLMGSAIQKEQPIASLRVRKAALKGAKIIVLNPVDYDFHFAVFEKQIVSPDEIVAVLAKIAAGNAIAAHLKSAQKACIVLGNMAFNHPEAATLRLLAQQIAEASGAKLLYLTEGANAAGAWIAGAVPEGGLNAQTMLTEARKAYLLLNVEPDFDCANPVAANAALQQAEFVVSLSLFRNAMLDQQANVILPMASFAETAGTFVNMTGEWQSFNGVASPFEEARPAWKILRVLGNLFHLSGFDYDSSEDVRHEIKSVAEKTVPPSVTKIKLNLEQLASRKTEGLHRIGEIPLYAGDSLVRRAKALQAAQVIREGQLNVIRMHPKTAAHLQVQEGDIVSAKQKQGEVHLPVMFDARLPERGIFIAGGMAATCELSELFGAVQIQKITV